MFRLALNVSATRLVLLHGYAGSVISSFGNFVVGGNLIVGLVVFLILIVIQFVVVTTGAGRVAEVAARFTLDAMPGKQMAIDADLNSGLINQQEAKRRRQETSDEADFYGAMDGAAKFVRGDAIAAIVITAINLIGGLTIGIAQRHLSVSDATHTYSLLSVGDGLVSQIPALLMSISTGLIVTRAATDDEDFGTDLIGQVRRQHRAIQIAGVVMTTMAIVPGLPHFAFLVVGGLLWFTGTRLGRVVGAENAVVADDPDAVVHAPDSPQALAADMRVEALELELSVTLVDLVDTAKGGDLLERVKGLRRKLATEKGLIIPPVRTRDNVHLDNDCYAIRLHGVEVATGTAPAGRFLAIGGGLDVVPGEAVVEPVFGLPAKWVPAELRQQALVAGATVIDRSSVITTHLGEVAARHAGQLLSAQQVKTLLDSVKQTDPAVLEEMGAAQVTLTDLHRVLCGLLEEGVGHPQPGAGHRSGHRAGPSGQGSRSDAGGGAPGPRSGHHRHVREGRHPADHESRTTLRDGSWPTPSVPATPGPSSSSNPTSSTPSSAKWGPSAGRPRSTSRDAVLICASRLRPVATAPALAGALPRLGVLSVNELGPQVKIERIGVVSVSPAQVV